MPKKNPAESLAEGKGNGDQVVEEAVINIDSRHIHTHKHVHMHDFLFTSQYPTRFLLEANFTV